MQFKAIVMGFATVHKIYLNEEYSPNFVEVFNKLRYCRYSNLLGIDSVNTGDDECAKRGVRPPVETSLRYTSDFIKINRDYRKCLDKVKSNLNEYVWPTVVLMFDERNNLIGIIVVPDGNWSSIESDFMKNLEFFLDPFGANHNSSAIDPKRGLQAPNRNVIEINFDSWRRELHYEIEKAIQAKKK
ncbi:MAG: hypothetical protein Q4G02_02835 [bacterium]|nr:hypothetical protein [bacterium]